MKDELIDNLNQKAKLDERLNAVFSLNKIHTTLTTYFKIFKLTLTNDAARIKNFWNFS